MPIRTDVENVVSVQSKRLAALQKERNHLQDLLKACQLAGVLPEGLIHLVNCATAEESEAHIALRLSNARLIIDQACASIEQREQVWSKDKRIWVTSKNQKWASQETGLTIDEIKTRYAEARRLGVKCTIIVKCTQVVPK